MGAILGFRVLSQHREQMQRPGYLIEQPHLRVTLTAGFVLLLSVFAFVRCLPNCQFFEADNSLGVGYQFNPKGFPGSYHS